MATKKVTKSKSAKVVTKKTVTKKTKKATAIAKVKALKHKRVVLEPIGTETLPDMVRIVSGPSWASDLIGKRYANFEYAVAQIEFLDTEKVIAKGAKAVKTELVAAGVTPLDTESIETDGE